MNTISALTYLTWHNFFPTPVVDYFKYYHSVSLNRLRKTTKTVSHDDSNTHRIWIGYLPNRNLPIFFQFITPTHAQRKLKFGIYFYEAGYFNELVENHTYNVKVKFS
jgi:hypothetical protein